MRLTLYACIVLLLFSCNSENPNIMLGVAVEEGNLELMREALAKGADPDEATAYDFPVLCGLIDECNMEGIQLLLREGANPNVDCDGEPGLMTALECEFLPVIKLLVEAGADVNAQDEFGITTLAWSITTEQTDVFKYLLANGASMDIRDSSGFHPVVYATTLDVLKTLEELNFPTDVVSSNGTTFLMDAVDTGSDDIVEYLPFDENPQAINPSTNFVYSANHQIDSVRGKLYPGYYQPQDRAKRIVELLEEKEKFSKDEMAEMLYDVKSSTVPAIIDDLLENVDNSNLIASERKVFSVLENL